MSGSKSLPPSPEELILNAISAPSEAMDWLHSAQRHITASPQPEPELMILSAQARRRMGSNPLAPGGLTLGIGSNRLQLGDLALGDTVRILLLLQVVRSFPDRETELVSAYFNQGDELERAAVIRALTLFPRSGEHKPVALEAGRATSLLLYSALALDNPYPAIYYDEHEFNQTVLKCLFTGLKIEHIMGLDQRINPNLSHMCEDYLDERLAANRAVPRDIWLAMAPFASERAQGLLVEYLSSDDPDHRYYTALAATHQATITPQLTAALALRLERETAPRILEVLARTDMNSI